MAQKYCRVGDHYVHGLWDSEKKDKQTGEIIQPGCCKSCLGKKKIRESKKTKEEIKELTVFFAEASLVFPVNCENCGERLDNSSPFARKSQTCHILPKTKNGGFPSISTHPSNKVFMCCFHGCHGHGDWDNLDAEKRKRMQVYEIAIERFKTLEKHLNEKEKLKAYKYLGL